MDFELTPVLKDLKALTNEVCTKEVYPLVKGWDQEGQHIPKELNELLGDVGLYGLTVPKEYGGSNMGFLPLAIVQEEACYAAKAGIMLNIISAPNCAFAAPFIHYGTEEQKQKYLVGTCSGRLNGCMALTEPTGSSALAAMSTFAEDKGDHYVVNGQKVFITHGDTSDYVETICQSEKGHIALVIDRGTKGLTVGKSENKMGIHGTGLNPIYYDNVIVPKENLIGKPGDGMKVASRHCYEVRMCVGAASVGMAQAAIDLALDYSKQRYISGKPLSSYQNTQFVLAEAQTKVDAARLLVYRAAVALDNHDEKHYMVTSSMAKAYASEIADWVVDKCLQVFGGYGYCGDYDIERMYRDIRAYRILDGATEIHKRLISKYMGVR